MSDNLEDRPVGPLRPFASLDDVIALARSRLPVFARVPERRPGDALGRRAARRCRLARDRRLQGAAGRARPGAAIRPMGAHGRPGPQLSPAVSDRDGDPAEGHPDQSGRGRKRRRKPDADRRREHRRGRRHRLLEGPGPGRLCVQGGRSPGDREGRGGQRHPRSDRPQSHPGGALRPAPGDRRSGAGAAAVAARFLSRRNSRDPGAAAARRPAASW